MGIVFLVIDILLYQAAPWLRFVKDLMVGRIRFRVARALLPSLGLAAAATVIVGVGINVARAQPTLVLMFLGGTGISGSTAHSVVQRETAFSDTLRVFQNNPLVGTSLGGVSPAIAALNGATVQSFEDSKSYEGMSVFAEALAASGLIGVLPFVWFLLETVVKPLRLARTAPASDSALLRAMVRSLLFLWAILQFNQNILRPYVWVHLAILATIYARAARATTEKLQKLDVG
jgi:hypothetical protein